MVVSAALKSDLDSLCDYGWDMCDSWLKEKEKVADIKRWRWYYDCYGGRFWPDQDESEEVRAYINFVFAQAQLRVAVNIAQKPTVNFLSNVETDKAVQKIQKGWDKTWELSKFNYRRMLIVKDSYITGTGVAKLLNSGDTTELDVINPLQLLVSPGATEIERAYGAAHVQNVHMYTAKELGSRWASHPDNEIQPNLDDIVPGVIRKLDDLDFIRGQRRGTKEKTVTLGSNATRTYGAEISGGEGKIGASDLVTMIEVYFWEEGVVKLLVIAGVEPVYFGPAPIRNKLPFVLYRPFPDSASLWGLPFAQVFESELDWTAKMTSTLLEGVIDASTMVVLSPNNSDVDLQSMRNGRGMQLVTYTPGTQKPEALQLSRVPGEAFQILPILSQFMESVTGRTDAMRGVNPSGVTSGDQLNMLVETATSFLRPEIAAMEQGDEELARIWADTAGYKDVVDNVQVEPGSTAGFRKMRQNQLLLEFAKGGLLGPARVARKILFKAFQLEDMDKWVAEIEKAEKEDQSMMAQMGANKGGNGVPTSVPFGAV